MQDFAAYLLYRASSALIAALPLPIVFRLGQVAGTLAWVLLPHYRHLALRNVAIGQPDKSAVDRRRLVRRHFQLLGANLLSSVKISTMPAEQIENRVSFENMEP